MQLSGVWLASLALAQTGGEVVIPLDQWLAMEREIAERTAERPPPTPYLVRHRHIDASFERGVMHGTMTVVVEALDATGNHEVPLLDADASLASVTIDGRSAVAVRHSGHYAIRLPSTGLHEVKVEFAHGREQARFTRAFLLRLPRAPISLVTMTLPERELDVQIEGGVVRHQIEGAFGTRVRGAFNGRDLLSVRWRRRATHDAARAKEMEVEAQTLLSLEQELAHTQTVLTYTLVAGETDRVEAVVPEVVEVTRVTGDAILQWYTELDASTKQRRLVVLLKHLVSDSARIVVHAQAPLAPGTEAEGQFITPVGAALRDVWIAVEGRAGFDLTVKEMTDGEAIHTREVPTALSNLTEKPLLYAYRGRGKWPSVKIARTRNAQIDLTQAVIDDMQASSVVVAQGLEVTKIRLYLRNNTRQYLAMRLPDGAKVTHAMIDGAPFLPAVTTDASGERLLVPLRQSERISGNKRRHLVRPGDTLGGISLRYFGTTDRWNDILDNNFDMAGPDDLATGRYIDIPSRAGGVTFEESNFVVEIAYKRDTARLGRFGRHHTKLPALDIPVMSATWHYYFPADYEPIRFASNLKQLSAIRYDPIRRLKQFWDRARFTDHAWAGSDAGYSNILQFRKAIWAKEQQQQVTEALAAFPLVGHRYRFERVLLESERGEINLTYVERGVLPWFRLIAFVLALVVALRFALQIRRAGFGRAFLSGEALTLAAVVGAGAFIGHFVLGVHRHTLLGVDAGLALVFLPPIVTRWFSAARLAVAERRISFPSWWRTRTIFKIGGAALALTILMAFPLLLSSVSLLVLLLVAAFSKGASRD